MPWRLVLSRRAARELERVPARDRSALRASLDRLQQDPSSVDMVKLKGETDRWRLRVGRWRAILGLDNQEGIIYVLRVLPRGRAYRD